VRERQSLANGLAEYMDRLGLERRHPVKSISDLLHGDTEQPHADTRQ
jgi:hypothetical protein